MSVIQFPGKTEAKPETPASVEKRAVFLAQMARGETFLRLTPDSPGVRVPDECVKGPVLVLKFSYAYKPNDVELTAEGLSQTLSFGGSFFNCFIPWAAIWGIGEVLWVESIPEALTLVIHPRPEISHKLEEVH